MEINKINQKGLNRIYPLLVFLLISIGVVISMIHYFRPSIFQDDQKETLQTVYFAGNITPAHQKLIEAFNKINKNKIEVIAINFQNEKFTTNKRKALITRNLRSRQSKIDLFSVDQIWIPRFAKWAENLQPYFSKDELNKFLASALSTCSYEGQFCAVPFFIDVGVMYFRKDIIGKLPDGKLIINKIKKGISWDEMIKLKKRYFNNQYFYVFQGLAYEGLICNYIENSGNNPINNHTFRFESVTQEAITFLFDIIHRYHMAPIEVTKFDEPLSFKYAYSNDIPFVRGWPTTLNITFTEKVDSQKISTFDIAPLPHIKGKESVSTLGGWNVILSNYSTVKEEAITFIKFMVSPEGQEIMFKNGGHLPVLKQFYENSNLLLKYPKLVFYRQLINHISDISFGILIFICFRLFC